MNWFCNLFKLPTAEKLAQQQLAESKRLRLLHATQAKYHEAMEKYHTETAERLDGYVNGGVIKAVQMPVTTRRRATSQVGIA